LHFFAAVILSGATDRRGAGIKIALASFLTGMFPDEEAGEGILE
jgi:hypothetical protein